MRALVVYESMWGNTREVAEAVARGVGGARAVECRDVGVDEVDGLDLLVVGDERAEHFLLRLEVHVEGAQPHAGALGDVRDRGLVVAARAKLFPCGIQQPPQGAPSALGFWP